MAPRAVKAIRKLRCFQAFRLEHILRSLPNNGNATTTLIHAAQSFHLGFFSSITRGQQRRKKTGR
ncbi:MAG: hypothetical protein OEM61_03395 [Desulfobacteraceae bacterium]|nr:hypothetical protein [Desulfobacteraceae bacterium]